VKTARPRDYLVRGVAEARISAVAVNRTATVNEVWPHWPHAPPCYSRPARGHLHACGPAGRNSLSKQTEMHYRGLNGACWVVPAWRQPLAARTSTAAHKPSVGAGTICPGVPPRRTAAPRGSGPLRSRLFGSCGAAREL